MISLNVNFRFVISIIVNVAIDISDFNIVIYPTYDKCNAICGKQQTEILHKL